MVYENTEKQKELFEEFPDHDFEFQVVFEDEWQNKINQLMQ